MRRLVGPILMAVAFAGCSDNDSLDGGGAGETAEAPCTATIAAGATAGAIQQALIDAQTGAILCFESGTYAVDQELSLTVAGVTLRGPSDHSAVIDFKTQTAGAQGFAIRANDFVMQGLAVKNTKGDGVRVDGSTGVTFRNVLVSWDNPTTGAAFYSGAENGAYALYPVGSTDVLVEDCEVVGSSDAGIYVGQSTEVVVRNNNVHGCVAGIEIENCVNSEVYGNEATDNTGGILVFDLPNLTVTNGHTTRVHHNTVYQNNRANFAPDGVVQMVPSGTGVMVLAAKDTEIDHNSFAQNGTTAVLAVSLPSLAAFDPTAPAASPGYDPWMYDLYVHDNVMTANGSAPGGVFATAGLAQVIHFVNGNGALDAVLWDGFGKDGSVDNSGEGDNRICVSANIASTTRNLNIAQLGAWIQAGDESAPLPPLPQDQADINCSLDTHAEVSF